MKYLSPAWLLLRHSSHITIIAQSQKLLNQVLGSQYLKHV